MEPEMTVRLTLLCHASTSAVRGAAFPADEPLDPQGQVKASALAGDLSRVDVAWTSPALRARQTAAALHLDAEVDHTLRDIDIGRWAGRSLAETQTAEPDELAAWTSDPSAVPHGGESIVDLLERIAPWLDARSRDRRRSVAVTHSAVIRAAVILAIDAKPTSFWHIDVAPLCRVDLRGDGHRWTLRSIGT
jgi:broad specificity phosphatase PhoE